MYHRETNRMFKIKLSQSVAWTVGMDISVAFKGLIQFKHHCGWIWLHLSSHTPLTRSYLSHSETTSTPRPPSSVSTFPFFYLSAHIYTGAVSYIIFLLCFLCILSHWKLKMNNLLQKRVSSLFFFFAFVIFCLMLTDQLKCWSAWTMGNLSYLLPYLYTPLHVWVLGQTHLY